MARSVLLQLARDSIAEVFEAKRTIVKDELYQKHPLLQEKMATKVNLYLDNELRGSAFSQEATRTLLDDIVINAKKSAFEDVDFSPITTSEYLSCEVEVILSTQDGIMSEKDPPILEQEN